MGVKWWLQANVLLVTQVCTDQPASQPASHPSSRFRCFSCAWRDLRGGIHRRCERQQLDRGGG